MNCNISDHSLYEKVLCILDEHDVVYRDCDGVIQGDCTMCSGEDGSDIITNTLAFNPSNNQLVSVVNGIASSTFIVTDTNDVITVGPLTVGLVTYPQGTSLHTILQAMIAQNHPAASVSGGSNPALSIVNSTQVLHLNLNAPGSFNNTVSGLTATSIQGAIDELVTGISSLPPGQSGSILIHNGVEYVSCYRKEVIYRNYDQVSFLLPDTPLSFAPFEVYRNGQRLISPDDYTRSGTMVTLDSRADDETIAVVYYLTV